MIRLGLCLFAAGLAGCAGPPATQAPPPTLASGGSGSRLPVGGGGVPYVYSAPPPALRGGEDGFSAPAPGPAVRDQAAVAAGCRTAADGVLLQRDRSELMREDERDSRLGTNDSIYALRAPIDRLGRQFERDRIANDCVQENTRGSGRVIPVR